MVEEEESEDDEELRQYIIAKKNNPLISSLEDDGFVAQKQTTDPDILFRSRPDGGYNSHINSIFNSSTENSNQSTPMSTPSISTISKKHVISSDDEIYPSTASTMTSNNDIDDGGFEYNGEPEDEEPVSFRPSTPQRRGLKLRASLQDGFQKLSSILTTSPYSPLSWPRRRSLIKSS